MLLRYDDAFIEREHILYSYMAISYIVPLIATCFAITSRSIVQSSPKQNIFHQAGYFFKGREPLSEVRSSQHLK